MKREKRAGKQIAPKSSTLRRSVWILIALLVMSVAVAVALFRPSPPSFNPTSAANPPMTEASAATAFGPTIPPVPAPSPHGMVWISGGKFAMGAMEPPDGNEVGMHGAADARPIHRVYVDGFWMDETDVTNEEFSRFVKATGYVTVAERKPRAEDFPGAPPENLVAVP